MAAIGGGGGDGGEERREWKAERERNGTEQGCSSVQRAGIAAGAPFCCSCISIQGYMHHPPHPSDHDGDGDDDGDDDAAGKQEEEEKQDIRRHRSRRRLDRE